MFAESKEVENYVNDVKEQIMNTTQQNNSDYGLHYFSYLFLSLIL